MHICLETNRLIVRSFRDSDAKAAAYNSSRPNVAHYMSDMVMHTEKEALGWIRWIRSRCNNEEPCQVLAIESKETGQCIGLIGVAPKRELGGEIEILFEIADEYTNRGYATEAGRAILQWCFEHTNLDYLVAIVKLDNPSSIRVIEKLGYQFIDQREVLYDGKPVLFHYYRLFRKLEPMDEFFNKRAGLYDDHMLVDLNLSEFYDAVDECLQEIPASANLLDLGCGTGLELDKLLARRPALHVTGIDLSQEMLNRLQEKYPDRDLNLICGSYYEIDLGMNLYHYAVSTYSLHHVGEAMKRSLYIKIHRALKENGVYIEGDYTVPNAEMERDFLAVNEIRTGAGDTPEGFFHFDVPFTPATTARLLKEAGFSIVEIVRSWDSKSIIKARK